MATKSRSTNVSKKASRKALSPDGIMQLGFGFWSSRAFLSAIELSLFTELAKGPLDAATLQRRCKLHQRSTRDFLDTLVALGMLRRKGAKYSNTPETDLFLDRNKPGYVGGILEMAAVRLYPFWSSLTEALHTGQPQNESKGGGGGLFESLYADPKRLRIFLEGMTGVSMGPARAIAQKFPWKKYGTLMDIGGAQGCASVQVALAHAHVTGGVFDLPPVGPVYKDYVKSFGLEQRLKFVGGNFFKDALPSADVLLMGHILHDWNLEEKLLLLSKAYQALPKGGALIVYDAIIDDERKQNAGGLLMSLNMIIETPGGFDYTGADCRGWMKKTGFRKTSAQHLAGADSMVVGIK